MTTKLVLRMISAVLVIAGVLVYIAAKIHFFRHYGETNYFREHSIYWILLASIGLLLFVVERFLPEKPNK